MSYLFRIISGCNYKAENDKGFLNSPTNYPDFQYCSWMVTVNDSFVISLIFTSLNVSYCDENYIEIYNGFNDTAPLLARHCGLNATSGTKVETTGNNLYVVLKSGNNSRSPKLDLGFNAKYTARKRRSSSRYTHLTGFKATTMPTFCALNLILPGQYIEHIIYNRAEIRIFFIFEWTRRTSERCCQDEKIIFASLAKRSCNVVSILL